MLKFIKHNLETIIGIEIFPIISFIIFFLFFCSLFIWVFKMQKAELNHMAYMPLNEENSTEDFVTSKTNNHE